MDGITKAKARGIKFGRRKQLTNKVVKRIRERRRQGSTIPQIMKDVGLSKATVHRALAAG